MKKKDALRLAACYGLEDEVSELINAGYTPTEALNEWDLL